MQLSIVIPVYNAAPYLDACVGSLRELEAEIGLSMEIVLVDDGSTDGSSELCDQLGDKVIHQVNVGVSAARNAGMKYATGDWLWFVDADDRTLLAFPLEGRDLNLPVNADFVMTGFIWEENGRAESFGASESEIPYNLWRCWFRRELVEKHHIWFTDGRKYAEDQEFILRYLLAIKDCKKAAIPEIKYYYTVRLGSAITKKGVKCKKVCDILGVTASMWYYTIRNAYFPGWIWFQTRRLLRTAMVSSIR